MAVTPADPPAGALSVRGADCVISVAGRDGVEGCGATDELPPFDRRVAGTSVPLLMTFGAAAAVLGVPGGGVRVITGAGVDTRAPSGLTLGAALVDPVAPVGDPPVDALVPLDPSPYIRCNKATSLAVGGGSVRRVATGADVTGTGVGAKVSSTCVAGFGAVYESAGLSESVGMDGS